MPWSYKKAGLNSVLGRPHYRSKRKKRKGKKGLKVVGDPGPYSGKSFGDKTARGK
jgi:hypothetical protein